MNYFDTTCITLRNNGYKITEPRKGVVSVLAEADKPLTAYEIQATMNVSGRLKAFSIYRILDVLVKLGLVHRILSCNAYVRCGHLATSGCHHFMVCRQCHASSEFVMKSDCEIAAKSTEFSFRPESHFFEVVGLCQSCNIPK